ncbi:MAG: hypothetical protein WCT77_01700 [Bacteroidota bacterium]
MYFTGKLEIDPSQETIYKRVKPTKLFSKLLDFLTFGAVSDKQEHETFTAVAVLQQLNIGLRTLDIKNVIRLAVDDYDFYLDEKGLDDDLEQAMFEFKTKVDPIESEFFNTIYLVLEQIDDCFKYLVEIQIYRKHKIGEYPIKVFVNGMLTDFSLKEGETSTQLEDRIKGLFSSQDTYNKYLNMKKGIFDSFLDKLELAIRKFIRVDDIRKETKVQIIRPEQRTENVEQIKHERYSEPIYYGYYGFDNYFLYAMLWSGALSSSNLYMNNFMVVDDIGNPVFEVGDKGFNTTETGVFNIDEPFVPPTLGEITYFGGNSFDNELLDANLISPESLETDEGDTTDWLDTDEGNSDYGENASCNSCSSCGSCSSD